MRTFNKDQIRVAVESVKERLGQSIFTTVRLADEIINELVRVDKEPPRPGECMLDEATVLSHVKAAVINSLGEEGVTDDSRIDGLCADSLDAVEIVLDLEERTGRAIPDEVTEKLWGTRDATLRTYAQGLIVHWS